jgi:hypothetical protein
MIIFPPVIVGGGGPPSVELVDQVNFGNTPVLATTFTRTVSFGAVGGNRRIVIAMEMQQPGEQIAVTIGGVAADEVARATQNPFVGARYFALIFAATVPSGTSGEIAITTVNNIVSVGFAVYAMRNVRSITATDTDQVTGFTEGTTSLSRAIDIEEKGILIASASQHATVGGDEAGDAAWTNATGDTNQKYYETSGDFNAGQSSASYVATTAETARSITVSGIRNRVQLCVAAFR